MMTAWRSRSFSAIGRLSSVVCLLLSGCGFQPLYAVQGGAAQPALAQVRIANISDRAGQELRNLLIDKMQSAGRPSDPRYDLTVTLQESRADMGIRTDATSARSQILMTARYVLAERPDGKVRLSSYAATSVGYNKLDAQYSNLSSEEDARRRALGELSVQIVNRLALHFGAQAPERPVAADGE